MSNFISIPNISIIIYVLLVFDCLVYNLRYDRIGEGWEMREYKKKEKKGGDLCTKTEGLVCWVKRCCYCFSNWYIVDRGIRFASNWVIDWLRSLFLFVRPNINHFHPCPLSSISYHFAMFVTVAVPMPPLEERFWFAMTLNSINFSSWVLQTLSPPATKVQCVVLLLGSLVVSHLFGISFAGEEWFQRKKISKKKRQRKRRFHLKANKLWCSQKAHTHTHAHAQTQTIIQVTWP